MRNTGKKGPISRETEIISMFMCGDVMTGRGIDQVLPHPSVPLIHEPFMKSATGYLEIAEKTNGPIPRPVSFSYIWGYALGVLERLSPDLRIINLETSITESENYWRDKGINYRMHPENIPALLAAKIDYCALANNHILDWGYSGLTETIETLKRADVRSSGAGQDLGEAETPAMLEVRGKGRVIVFSFGSVTSGIPAAWAASRDRPGVHLLKDFSDRTIHHIKEKVLEVKRSRDIVVATIHWGSNWGYQVPQGQIEFAHKLIENAGVDVIHGHSSHHVKGIEVCKGKLIIYGCGDFLNDYEGIAGGEDFRSDLSLMYFAGIDPLTGRLAYLQMIPTRIKRFTLTRPSREEVSWLRDILDREGKRFGTRVQLTEDETLALKWD